MHSLLRIVNEVNKTHKGLGELIATNILAAKARKCILNISPAGCGKSTATDCVHAALGDISRKYSSMTLAGLRHLAQNLSGCTQHLLIDDLGAEKSYWARTSTITVLATLVHTGYIYKITQQYAIEISGFLGSAAINIQPVLMNALVADEDWVAVVRDKTLRYYHLYRPRKPKDYPPNIKIDWGTPKDQVQLKIRKGKLWYQVLAYGLTQWSYARCLEHIPDYLKAAAALDGRTQVETADYHALIKLLKPMALERYILKSFGMESGRLFQGDVFCLLTELATDPAVPIETVCEDYKVSPKTIERVVQDNSEWFWIKNNSPKLLMPTEYTQKILNLIGVKHAAGTRKKEEKGSTAGS
jgi:hypothetical protein